MESKLQKQTLKPILLGLAALVLLAASPAHAAKLKLINVTVCGQNLSAAGQYVLVSNLDCSGSNASGINITASNVAFHLAGHTISSTDCNPNINMAAIFVSGGISGVVIEGGTVKGFNDGIDVSLSTAHVSGMTVTSACEVGIALSGPNNQVDTSTVTLNGADGIGIGSATGTHILANDISGNVAAGVDISNVSNGNFVENNIITGNGITTGQGGVAIFNGSTNLIAYNAFDSNFNGIEIESPGNTAFKNTVNRSVSTGIFITTNGSPSTVKSNTALSNAVVDLSDDDANCNGDTWKGDTFQTSVAGGIKQPKCIN